jgi:filamentous hemagglutinin family protein
MILTPLCSIAAPIGGEVQSGNATISHSGTVTTINQTSQHAGVDWQSFNVGSNETVNFIQPNSSSSTLNRIHDQDPSSILGSVNSNGHVYLSNPNGFIFGANSNINVGAFLATTSEISEFNDGQISLSNPGEGFIISDGNITSSAEGFIGFFAPSITNNGQLNSPHGDILLTNANQGTLYLPDSAGIGFIVDSLESLNPIGISNSGNIKAEGGQVLLTSAAIDSTFRNAVNNEGIINVSSIENDGGTIRILASRGSIEQGGELNADAIISGNGGEVILIANQTMIHTGHSSARGGELFGNGGFIETSGLSDLQLNTSIDTRALNGEWGSWLIDPTTMDVGDGTAFDSAFVESGLSSSQLVVFAADTINVEGAITTTSSGTLRLSATDLNINQSISTSSLDLNSTTTNLNSSASLTASGEVSFLDDSTLNINGSSVISITDTGSLSLKGVKIIGADGNDSLTINTINGKIDLRNMAMTDAARLDSFIINRNTSSLTNANNESISISGDIYANTFSIINDISSSNPEQNINLSNDTNITSVDSIFTNTIFNGSNSSLNISATNSANLNAINDISALNIDTVTLTLTGDISTLGAGINIQGGSAVINKGVDSTLSLITYNTGNLVLASSVTSATNDENMSLTVTDGEMSLSGIASITDLSLSNASTLTNLNGDINIAGNMTTSANEITLVGARNITADNIDFSNTDITTTSAIVLSANTSTGVVQLSDLDATALTVNSSDLQLGGRVTTDLTTASSLDLSGSGKISIAKDSVLTGNLLLTAPGVEAGTFVSVAIDNLEGATANSLEVVYTNQDFTLGQVGATNALQSFTLNGSGQITLANTETFSINTTGSNGISLLGDLNLELLTDMNIDTSDNSGGGGDINLSGLNIDGGFAVNLNSGSGNTSLGTIGSNSAVASLTTLGTGNIELYGNISNLENTFDFSKASSVILNNNITFGSTDLYLTSLLLGDVSINGNYDLSIFSSIFTSGTIGQNIALQNLSINTLDQALNITHDINTAGNINITGGQIDIASKVTSTGGSIAINSLLGINMDAAAILLTDFSNITLTASEGDIAISSLSALEAVSINATAGNITNSIDDYTSNTSTSTNITSQLVTLSSGSNIGTSVASPIVINAGKEGDINLTAGGNIYIANLENSATSTNKDIFDNSSLTTLANADILNQLKPEVFNTTQFKHLEISNPIWQLDQFHQDNANSNSSPRIYYSKKGWRLGNPK